MIRWLILCFFASQGILDGRNSLSNSANILAIFSQTYVVSLPAQGVKTRLPYAVRATHVSVPRSPEFFMLAQALDADLSK